MSIREWAANESPRDKLLQAGAHALSDAELLSVLSFRGHGRDSTELPARTLLRRFGGLGDLLLARYDDVIACPGVGPATYAQLQAALELARRGALCTLRDGDTLSNPDQTRTFLQLHLGGRRREVFSCLFLDSQHRVLRCEDLFFGTLDGAAVYPREVAVRALQYDAAAVIFAHNHPSGVAEPSSADRRITERLKSALSLLDIRVLDHFIVGRGREYSFAEQGLL